MKKKNAKTSRRNRRRSVTPDPSPATVDDRRAVAHLMDLLRVEGTSGRERAVASLVKEKLIAAGCRASWVRHDTAHRKIAPDFEVGNLIVRLPGTERAPRRLFSGHLDTVPLCRGARPVRRGNRIVAEGDTGLGADNRTAVACLVTLLETLLRKKLPHPPLTFLFTIAEEIGLRGSRHVSLRDLGNPRLGFNIDSGHPRRVVVGALGADRWEVDVNGRSAHAGVHPEDGISALLIASRAIVEMSRRGFFGKIRKGGQEGTANVGVIEGGEATNEVTAKAFVRGESRSHDPTFVATITNAWRDAFRRHAAAVTNASGRRGRITFRSERDYDPFLLSSDDPVVALTQRVIRKLRMRPELVVANGGLDANHLNAMGIPTVTLGAGQHRAHTVDEYADINEYLKGCRLALALALSTGPK